MSASHTIGIDIGGTNLKGACCDADARLVCERTIETEASRGFEHVFDRILKLIDRLIAESGVPKERFAGIGVGAPGPMSHREGIIHHAPNLPGWNRIPLRALLADRTGLPVSLENDANAAAFGEYRAGAGRGARTLVLLTLGTGIGGGLILEGRLWRGAQDTAGEIGHLIVVPGGRPCPCGQCGCLERYSSASAVAQRAAEALAAGRASILRHPVDARAVCAAVRCGDALAQEVWDDCCRGLALALISIHHLLNPEVVVLAGGLIHAGDTLLRPVARYFEQMTWKIAPDAPRLRLATLGANAGMIGAALLAREA